MFFVCPWLVPKHSASSVCKSKECRVGVRCISGSESRWAIAAADWSIDRSEETAFCNRPDENDHGQIWIGGEIVLHMASFPPPPPSPSARRIGRREEITHMAVWGDSRGREENMNVVLQWLVHPIQDQILDIGFTNFTTVFGLLAQPPIHSPSKCLSNVKCFDKTRHDRDKIGVNSGEKGEETQLSRNQLQSVWFKRDRL